MVLAIVGAILVVSYAQGADHRAIENLEPVKVLVVKAAIPAGTPVEAMTASVSLEELPAAAVTDTALATLADSAGKVAAVDLVVGEQLVSGRLVTPDELPDKGIVGVPPGLQEVSFEIEPRRVVGGRINAGDHVGVFLSFDGGADKTKPEDPTTQLTLRKVLVTAVQRTPQTATTEQPTDTIPSGLLMLTVAVTDVDAAKVVFASEFGRLWLSKEPLDAQDNGPRVERKEVVYK